MVFFPCFSQTTIPLKFKLAILILTLCTICLWGQEPHPKLKIGYNFIPLLGKSTELLVEKNATSYLSVCMSLGNTWGATRGYYKVDDGVSLAEMHGYFFKTGLRYYPLLKWDAPTWIGASAIGSKYYEKGTRFGEPVSASGFTWGFGLSGGYDFKINNFLDLRTGLQIAWYHRDDHLSSDDMTYQPGIGASFPMPLQGILALLIKIP